MLFSLNVFKKSFPLIGLQYTKQGKVSQTQHTISIATMKLQRKYCNERSKFHPTLQLSYTTPTT